MKKKIVAAVAACLAASGAAATTYTWTGSAGTTFWSNAANWSPGGVPQAGDSLQFSCPVPTEEQPNPMPMRLDNDLAPGTQLSITATGVCTIFGNAITSTSIDAERTIMFPPLRLPGNGSYSLARIAGGLDVGPYTLALETNRIDGGIVGSGSITAHGVVLGIGPVMGGGVVMMYGANSFSGTFHTIPDTDIFATTLLLDGSLSAQVRTARLRAKGSVGPVTTESLEVDGSLSLQSLAVTFGMRSTYANTTHVAGDVVLDGAQFLDLGGVPRAKRGQVFTILEKAGAGAISGSFANAPEGTTLGPANMPMRISYVGGDGNDLTATALRGTFVMSDFEGDGRSDLLWHNDSTGLLYRMSMDGAAIVSREAIYQEPNTAWRVVGEGDFDGDGAADVLWRNVVSGDVYLMTIVEGRPTGGALIYREANPDWRIVATRDLDGDSLADILWWNAATGETYVLLMSGMGIKARGYVPTQLGVEWKFAAAARMEGAGPFSHLVWRHAQNGQVMLTRTNFSIAERTTTVSLVHTEPDYAWRIVGTGAVNTNYPEDIFWFNDQTGDLYVMMAPGPSRSQFGAGAVVHRAGPGWKPMALADYDGDGKTDVAWRHPDGRVHVMLLNGLAVKGGQTVHVEPDASWKLLGLAEYLAP